MPVYVVVMTAVNTLLRSLDLRTQDVPIWLVVGFAVASSICLVTVVVLLGWAVRGNVSVNSQRFILAILASTFVAGLVEDVLYGLLYFVSPDNRSFLAAIPISVIGYCVLVATLIAVQKFYTSTCGNTTTEG